MSCESLTCPIVHAASWTKVANHGSMPFKSLEETHAVFSGESEVFGTPHSERGTKPGPNFEGGLVANLASARSTILCIYCTPYSIGLTAFTLYEATLYFTRSNHNMEDNTPWMILSCRGDTHLREVLAKRRRRRRDGRTRTMRVM